MADTTLHLGVPIELAQKSDAVRDCREVSGDALLIEGLQKGEESAYETLIAGYQQPVYNLVCRLLNEPGDACDIVQEVFLKVFRKIGAFRGESSLKTWLYRIAVNEAYNQQRWLGRHRRREVGLEDYEEANLRYFDMLPDPGRSPFDCVAGQEQHAIIQGALGRLNPSFRSAVVLRDVEDLSYEEIADILQIALGTVKSRIVRGREALRKDLSGRLEPDPALNWTPQTAE